MHPEKFENQISRHVAGISNNEDPAHDFLHFQRVVATAKALCTEESGSWSVVMPAAWLHDLVNVRKDDPRRSQASRLSAVTALDYLERVGYPKEYYADIAHAIEAHSFSANIPANTLEAKIVQDADRLDGLGAIGIARCFATAGLLKRPFYSEQDPFCLARSADDKCFTLDHFYAKLFRVAETMQTESGRKEGLRRLGVMKRFIDDFGIELGVSK